MSSDSSILHHNQQLLHNRYECEYHNGYLESRDHAHHVMECHHREEELDRQGAAVSSDAIIRGNMQYVNGELRKIPRPLNAFMIFSNEKRKELKKEFPGEPNNMISSRLGAAWKGLSDDARKKYHDMAHREDLEHRRKYPNYQYCPGHARKLKKARREQRLRQQGMYRGSRGGQTVQNPAITRRKAETSAKPKPATLTSASNADTCCTTNIKKETSTEGYPLTPPLLPTTSANQIVHGVTSGSAMPGPYGEGCYASSTTGFLSSAEAPPDCMLSCCNGCKPTDLYCCPDSHFSCAGSADALAGPHNFAPGPYPSPMFYFSPGYDSQFSADSMMTQPCMSGDCSTCYPASGYMDGCYTPLYPAAGDTNLAYKDLCFMPEMPLTNSPSAVTSAGSVMTPMSDGDTELTDISNNMVPNSCSQDNQVSSQNSCASKGSTSPSPSTLEDISLPSSMSAHDITSANDM